MPKSLEVSPERLQERGHLTYRHTPLYTYNTAFGAEREARGDDALIKIMRDMCVLREFETMLQGLRSKGQWEGVEIPYRGPAHLSVGQEAAAVGLALALEPHDHVYGSHRSHGEFLAKGLAAIESLDDNAVGDRMASLDGGALLQRVESSLGGSGKTLAEHFLLFGFLSEILMRETGFNGGMGGSMHAFFLPFGAYPNNAIVGGSAGIATGAALAMRRNSKDIERISIATSGDGSTGCGPVWEAMNFAAMAQFNTLWPEQMKGGLPVLFFFTNNFYAMGGQTIGETMAWDRLSRIAAGVNADALHAETVDGTRPFAVADAVGRQRDLLINRRGPCLLDVECYRQSGHSTSDANAYRSREELKAWAAHDGIERYAAELVDEGVLDEHGVTEQKALAKDLVLRVASVVARDGVAPPVDIRSRPTLIGDLMFSGTSSEELSVPSVDVATCSRVRQNAKKARFGIDDNGDAISTMRAITLRDALFEATLHHLVHRPTLAIWGEECREWGGAFGVYRGLSDLFEHDRVFNSPISEAAIVATAVGHALEGGRSLVELMYADFIGRAGDEIFNQMAKWQAMSGGVLNCPVVLRCSVGSKYGAQHSQDWSSLVAHVPGLRVFYPATPYDAKGMLSEALASNDPTVVFESQRLYDVTERFVADGVPEEDYRIEAGKPAIKRSGIDLTILTIGPSLYPAAEAAEELQETFDLSAELIDARCLVPFDYEPLLESVRRTQRLLIVSEACERASFAMTVAAQVSRFAHGALVQAPRVLGAPNWIVPGAEMESTYFPGSNDILDIVLEDWFSDRVAGYQSRGARRADPKALSARGL